MGGHGDQIAVLALGRGADLFGRITSGEHGIDVQAIRPEARADFLQVGEVVAHLLRLAQVQLLDVPCDPAVRHVDQDDGRPQALGQPVHVGENRLVGGGVLERDEDAGVHQASQPRNVWARSHALRAAITIATK